MNNNLNDLYLKAPREKDGARTLSRYSFQVHASLSKVLKFYTDGKDFRALFDHFDDLVIIENPEAAYKVRSYQIKGKNTGAWTAAALSKSDKKKKGVTSIVGKIYQLTEIFGPNLTGAHFLSNAHYNMLKANGSKTTVDDEEIAYSNLGKIEKDKFSASLDINFAAPRVPDEGSVIVFEKTDVPIKNHATMLKGELVDVLNGQSSANTTGIYNALVADVLAKSKNTTVPTSNDELFDLKSISSEQLSEALTQAEKRLSILDCWQEILIDLVGNNFTATDCIRLKNGVVDYLGNRSRGSTVVIDLIRVIEGKQLLQSFNATDLVESAVELKKAIATELVGQHEEMFVFAACLVEMFEALNEK
ncbi:MAG: dsDNA nuclease domain-containing protein [Pseudomonadales bacterium]